MKSVKPMFLRPTPIALAIAAVLHGAVLAQPAINTTSADTPPPAGLFESSGQATIGPRPFTSFLQRLSTPVDKISIKVANNNLTADGVSGTDVTVTLLDGKGVKLTEDVEVTVGVDGGARLLLPGRKTTEDGISRGDIDRIEPGTQAMVKGGELRFKLIAPYKPESVHLKVSVKGVYDKVTVRYVPELRDMIAVGLLEGR